MIDVRRRVTAALLLVGAAGPLAGCSSLGPDGASAARAAQQFHLALEQADGDQACALLAPGTLRELESSSEAACATAVLDEQLADAGGVDRTDRAGRGARVVLDHDVVFLSVFGDAWKVTAAGCTPQPDKPYDCTVKGG